MEIHVNFHYDHLGQVIEKLVSDETDIAFTLSTGLESIRSSPNFVSPTSRVETVLMMVDAGIAITVLPKHFKLYSATSLRYVNIEGDSLQVDIVASWKTKNASPSLCLFIEQMESLLSQPHDYFSFLANQGTIRPQKMPRNGTFEKEAA